MELYSKSHNLRTYKLHFSRVEVATIFGATGMYQPAAVKNGIEFGASLLSLWLSCIGCVACIAIMAAPILAFIIMFGITVSFLTNWCEKLKGEF